MALFWLCYRKSGRVSVAIVEAPSPMHARMRAALDGMNAAATFAEGHKLEPIMPRGCRGTWSERCSLATKLRRRCWTGLNMERPDRPPQQAVTPKATRTCAATWI
jgi:hypothetical protein